MTTRLPRFWDDKGHAPPLKTEADWIRAGEMVFESPLVFTPVLPPQIATEFYRTAGRPVPADGVDPFAVSVIRQKDKVEVGFAACAYTPKGNTGWWRFSIKLFQDVACVECDWAGASILAP